MKNRRVGKEPRASETSRKVNKVIKIETFSKAPDCQARATAGEQSEYNLKSRI
ncbi:MAG: hypothetical protein ABH886_03600 [Candidatus Desantisbacteria bacterium]